MSDSGENRDRYLTSKTLGECFQQSHEKGRMGLPIVSLTMDQGLLPRDQIERRVESNLPPEGHRLIRKGDLAYNMMRMWQGVCYSAKYDCLTSPAYVVLRPQPGVDSTFAEYYLRFEDTVAEFKRLSFGVVDDRLRLYFHDFSSVKCAIPSSDIVQRKIARILTTLDNVITQTEALIAKYQAIKQGLMHDLFTRGVDATGKLRPPQSEAPELYKQSELGWIPKEWGSTTVAEVLQHRPKNGYSPKESDEWTGTVMLGLGCLTLSGFQPIQLKNAPKNDANLERALLKDGDLLISRSNTRDLVALVGIYREIGSPCIYSDLMMRLVPANVVLPEYLEAILRHAPVRSQLTNASCGTSGSMMKINSEAVLRTVIALPSLEEQRVLLSRMTAISSLIEAELLQRTSLRQIKTGLMQDLLTGKVAVKADKPEEITR